MELGIPLGREKPAPNLSPVLKGQAQRWQQGPSRGRGGDWSPSLNSNWGGSVCLSDPTYLTLDSGHEQLGAEPISSLHVCAGPDMLGLERLRAIAAQLAQPQARGGGQDSWVLLSGRPVTSWEAVGKSIPLSPPGQGEADPDQPWGNAPWPASGRQVCSEAGREVTAEGTADSSRKPNMLGDSRSFSC